MSKENIKIDYDSELDKLSICYEDGTKVVIRILQEEAIPIWINEGACNCYDDKGICSIYGTAESADDEQDRESLLEKK